MFFRDQQEVFSFLTARRLYPIYRAGKVIFRKGKLPEKMKEEIIEKLGLQTKEECLLWQRKIKEVLKSDNSHKPIKEWVKEERPRELLLKEGAEKLSLGKLLAIILRTGSEGRSAEDLARELLNRFHSLRGIDNAPLSELQKIPGIGFAKATQIKAALELGKRLFREEALAQEKIRDVRGAIKFVKNFLGPYLRDAPKEYFYLLLLDNRNKVLDCQELSRGSRDASIVDKVEVLKEAVQKQASSVILVHNHPSGEPDPSSEDIAITKELNKALSLVGIRILDHIIIGRNETDYFSFQAKGLLSP